MHMAWLWLWPNYYSYYRVYGYGIWAYLLAYRTIGSKSIGFYSLWPMPMRLWPMAYGMAYGLWHMACGRPTFSS